jgi:hypothetical protein
MPTEQQLNVGYGNSVGFYKIIADLSKNNLKDIFTNLNCANTKYGFRISQTPIKFT